VITHLRQQESPVPDTSKSRALAGSVLVVDPHSGERLPQIWQPGRAAWIVMSPVNEPRVQSLWASHPEDHLRGITGIPFDPEAAPEARFLDYLGTIDLHHGPYSNATSYTELEVIGARLGDVREALSELGFAEFLAREDGFMARRIEQEAMKERN
jgi:hypothetical protein